MNNLDFDDVRALAAKNPKAALRVHFEGEDAEATEYYAEGVIPAMEEAAQVKVDDGEFDTVEEAMRYLDEITYICTEEDYQAEQSEQADRDEERKAMVINKRHFEAIELPALASAYDHVGFRVVNNEWYKVGDVARRSRIWVDGGRQMNC